MILKTIRIAVSSLKANKLRTLLSMLGIIIGVGAVIAIVSIGSGAQNQITGQISSLGSNVINISPNISKANNTTVSNSFTVELTDYINQASPSVKEVIPNIKSSGLLITANTDVRATVVGTNPNYQEINNYYPALGKFISSSDLDSTSNIIVLGSELAKDLFDDQNPVGEMIKFNYKNNNSLFTVIGVMEAKGRGFAGDFNAQAYIPSTTQLDKVTNSNYVTGYIAQAVSSDEAPMAVGQIEYFLTKYLGGADKFRLISQDQILDTVNQVTGTMSLMLGGIAAISLLVGGIGIMNIMLVSVTERTREIGIRKALGAKKKHIMSQFLIEALILSGIGGLIGIALGGVGAAIISKIAGWSLVVSIWAVIVAFGFALTVGIFFGIYPAIKAANLNPVNALSYE